MHRPHFRTGARGLPCALPRFEYHGEFTRIDAADCDVPPGEGATIQATVSHTDGMERMYLLDLVRGQSGRPFLVCPYCNARRAHLYAFLRRMERRGWVPTVPPRAFACRTCHRIRYASQ